MAAAIRPVIAALMVVVVATGCGLVDGNTHDYPAASKKLFMDNCLRTSGGQQAYCICALDELQAKYTYREFANIEKALTRGGPEQQMAEFQLQNVVKECLPR